MYIPVPQHLLKPCDNPGMDGLVYNEDMAKRLLDYDKSVKACSDDKAAINSLVNNHADKAEGNK